MEQINEEKFSNLELHPYYGLADKNGCLTRYPKEGLKISASDMAVFVNNGGSLDSCGVYGVSPYEGFEGLSPLKAAEFQRAAWGQRWDNVPTYHANLITVNDDCSFSDYLMLHCGAGMLAKLNEYGIKTNASLFTLARKVPCYAHPSESKWLHRKIAANFSFKNKAHMDWASNWRNELHKFASHGNRSFQKLVKDDKKYEESKKKYRWFREENYLKNDKLIAYCLNKPGYPGEYTTIKGVYRRFKIYYTSFGRMAVGRKFLHCKSEGVVYSGRIKKFGQFSAAKVNKKYFIWVTQEGFETHIEDYFFKKGLQKLQEKLSKSEEKNNILERGIISFRSFRQMTSSCLEGTKSWLWDNGYYHFYNLLSEFDTWSEVFATDVADIKFEMTPEFMESIKFRF